MALHETYTRGSSPCVSDTDSYVPYPELTKPFLKISCLGCTFRQIYTPGLYTRRPYVHSMYSRRPNPELAAGHLQARHRLGLLPSHPDRNTRWRWRWFTLRGSEAICHDAAHSLTASALVLVRPPSAARRFCSSSSQPEISRAPPLVHARSQHILQISTITQICHSGVSAGPARCPTILYQAEVQGRTVDSEDEPERRTRRPRPAETDRVATPLLRRRVPSGDPPKLYPLRSRVLTAFLGPVGVSSRKRCAVWLMPAYGHGTDRHALHTLVPSTYLSVSALAPALRRPSIRTAGQAW